MYDFIFMFIDSYGRIGYDVYVGEWGVKFLGG